MTLLLLVLPADLLRAQFIFVTNNGTITITDYVEVGGPVVIPSTINGLPVTGIGHDAFAYSLGIPEVTIPDSVTNIADYAFAHCENMSKLTIGNGVISIGILAFIHCHYLHSVMIPDSVTSIGFEAFFWCTPGLTNVVVGKNATNIDYYAFGGCANLMEIHFKGNAPNPDNNLFDYGNDNLIVYYLPGTTGWNPTFSRHATALWKPLIQTRNDSFGVRTNQFGFNIAWASGQVVVVEACTNPANPVWSPLQTNTLSSDTLYFSDPQWTNYPARFYRVRSP